MLDRVASWYGEQACVCYQKWSRTGEEADLRDFARYTALADKLWAMLRKSK